MWMLIKITLMMMMISPNDAERLKIQLAVQLDDDDDDDDGLPAHNDDHDDDNDHNDDDLTQ